MDQNNFSKRIEIAAFSWFTKNEYAKQTHFYNQKVNVKAQQTQESLQTYFSFVEQKSKAFSFGFVYLRISRSADAAYCDFLALCAQSNS